jgi:CBS domain-containing protein
MLQAALNACRRVRTTMKGAPVDDISDRLLDAISRLEAVADAVGPHDAYRHLDETSMQVFWRRWPGISSWSGSLWRLLNEELRRQGGTVAQLRDIMTTKVVTTSADRPVAEVTAMMVKARVGSAVVLQGSWLAGILTERDVLRAAASRSDLTTSPVSQWMTRDPVTATPDTTAEEAAHLMLTNGFRHLPVLEGRSLRGVVSIRDVLASGIRRRRTAE